MSVFILHWDLKRQGKDHHVDFTSVREAWYDYGKVPAADGVAEHWDFNVAFKNYWDKAIGEVSTRFSWWVGGTTAFLGVELQGTSKIAVESGFLTAVFGGSALSKLRDFIRTAGAKSKCNIFSRKMLHA
ncbi:MAG: hypothetical protein V4568_10660, partial [Pseudomonadota bacterium]